MNQFREIHDHIVNHINAVKLGSLSAHREPTTSAILGDIRRATAKHHRSYGAKRLHRLQRYASFHGEAYGELKIPRAGLKAVSSLFAAAPYRYP
jgi:hypothetical protein